MSCQLIQRSQEKFNRLGFLVLVKQWFQKSKLNGERFYRKVLIEYRVKHVVAP